MVSSALSVRYRRRPLGCLRLLRGTADTRLHPALPQQPVSERRLDYRSDKWNGRNGKKINYTHDLSSTDSDKVSTTGDGTKTRPPTCIFVKGPRLTVTERGIIY